jgi:hypothetical protein
MSNHWCEGKTRRREERATSTRGKGLVNDKSAADRYHGEGAIREEPEGRNSRSEGAVDALCQDDPCKARVHVMKTKRTRDKTHTKDDRST